MSNSSFYSLPDQVAGSIRAEITKGRWSTTVPGRDKLAKEFGVSGKTVEAALRALQKQGLLESQGSGRRRRIVEKMNTATPSLRIAILTFDPLLLTDGYMIKLQHQLSAAGYSAFFTKKSLTELDFDVKKVSRFVAQTKADAWIVGSAPRNVLEWLAEQPIPTFALFGRRHGLPIAGVGPDKNASISEATRRLLDLGHQRIALIARKSRRLPTPGAGERVFLKELADHGILTSNYHLPDWVETVSGFREGLEALFRITPPTALIVDEAQFFLAALQFCANRGLKVPGDISLISTDNDGHFEWFTPSVAHIHWHRQPVISRIERWAANISRGKKDLRQTLTKAEFIEGGTIGPVPA